MKSAENKKLYIITITSIVLVAVYICIFALAAADGRYGHTEISLANGFRSFINDGYRFLVACLIVAVPSMVIIGFIFLSAFIFYKLKLPFVYVFFAVINGMFILLLPTFGGGTALIFTFQWYTLMELGISIVLLFSFATLVVLSLVIRYTWKKIDGNGDGSNKFLKAFVVVIYVGIYAVLMYFIMRNV